MHRSASKLLFDTSVDVFDVAYAYAISIKQRIFVTGIIFLWRNVPYNKRRYTTPRAYTWVRLVCMCIIMFINFPLFRASQAVSNI